MTLLSKDYLLKVLTNLLPTEEQMKSVGLYIRTFKKDYRTIAEGWLFVYERVSVYHKLNLLYLANEVVQTVREIDLDSIELKIAFKKAVNGVFGNTKEAVVKNPPLYRKYCELENVWIQRNVMTLESYGLNLEDLLRSIEKSFCDKAKLSKILEGALARIRSAPDGK